MPDPKHGLGRRLDQLLPSAAWLKETDIQLFYCPIDRILANPYQPRHCVDDQKFPELVESVREKGILQPILVARTEQADRYQLLAGERRWRAALAAGLSEVPVVVRDASSVEALELALVENIQRSDLSCIEEAHAYRRLQAEFNLTQDQIAQRVGKSRSAVANLLRLLRLPPIIQQDLQEGRLSMGHARALLTLSGTEAQQRLRDQILAHGLSVRQTEQRAQQEGRRARSKPAPEPHWQRWQEALAKHLGTKVRFRRVTTTDTLTISFTDETQLKNLFRRLGLDPDAKDSSGNNP